MFLIIIIFGRIRTIPSANSEITNHLRKELARGGGFDAANPLRGSAHLEA